MDSPLTSREDGPSTPTRAPRVSINDTPTRLDAAISMTPGTMAPLEPLSPERINKQMASASPRTSNVSIHTLMSPARNSHSRDSSVSDKISQFNTLAAQGKNHERKAQDAALKRAVLGREEAEAEVRRCKDEVRVLKKQIEDGKERERKVGERLETVMVCPLPYFVAVTNPKKILLMTMFSFFLSSFHLGKLRSCQGDTCTYSSPLGEGDPSHTQGNLQEPERYRQTPRRTQGRAHRPESRRRNTTTREGAQPQTRAGGLRGPVQSGRPAGAAREESHRA